MGEVLEIQEREVDSSEAKKNEKGLNKGQKKVFNKVMEAVKYDAECRKRGKTNDKPLCLFVSGEGNKLKGGKHFVLRRNWKERSDECPGRPDDARLQY